MIHVVQLDMKKNIVVIVVLLLVLGIIFALLMNKQENPKGSQDSSTNASGPSVDNLKNKYLLEGFPTDVPLYKMTKIDSSKAFVNTDQKYTSPFNQKEVAYYNVVFETSASQKEFLDYYNGMFSPRYQEDYPSDSMVKGTIKQYKVTAAHYGADNTAYLQVFLSEHTDSVVSGYVATFPMMIAVTEHMTRQEVSYGLLSQKNGEVEYTAYYSVNNTGDQNKDGIDDQDEFALIQAQYVAQYKNESNYSFDAKTGTFQWKKEDTSVVVVLSRSHGRVYVTLRSPMKK